MIPSRSSIQRIFETSVPEARRRPAGPNAGHLVMGFAASLEVLTSREFKGRRHRPCAALKNNKIKTNYGEKRK